MLKLQVLQMQVWYMHTTFAWLSSVIYQEKKKTLTCSYSSKPFQVNYEDGWKRHVYFAGTLSIFLSFMYIYVYICIGRKCCKNWIRRKDWTMNMVGLKGEANHVVHSWVHYWVFRIHGWIWGNKNVSLIWVVSFPIDTARARWYTSIPG